MPGMNARVYVRARPLPVYFAQMVRVVSRLTRKFCAAMPHSHCSADHAPAPFQPHAVSNITLCSPSARCPPIHQPGPPANVVSSPEWSHPCVLARPMACSISTSHSVCGCRRFGTCLRRKKRLFATPQRAPDGRSAKRSLSRYVLCMGGRMMTGVLGESSPRDRVSRQHPVCWWDRIGTECEFTAQLTVMGHSIDPRTVPRSSPRPRSCEDVPDKQTYRTCRVAFPIVWTEAPLFASRRHVRFHQQQRSEVRMHSILIPACPPQVLDPTCLDYAQERQAGGNITRYDTAPRSVRLVTSMFLGGLQVELRRLYRAKPY